MNNYDEEVLYFLIVGITRIASLLNGLAADRESVFLKSVFVQLYGNALPMPLAEPPIVDPLCTARSIACSH